MTKTDLQELIPYLKECGVRSFRTSGADFEIAFFQASSPAQPLPKPPNSAESNLKTEKVEDVVVPQSLEEEPTMTFDKILNWSVESESPVPLTGVGEPNGR